MALAHAAKAFAGAGATFFSGAVTTIIVRIITLKWPGFLDADTLEAIKILVTAAVTGGAVYGTPNKDADS